MASSFGGTIKLKGESEYKKALRDITSNLKLMTSEMKLTSVEFSNGEKSVKQTKNSFDEINVAIKNQKSSISTLRDLIEKMSKQYDDQKSKLKELEEQYGVDSKEVAKFKSEMSSTENKLTTYKTQLNNAEVQLKQMEDATSKSTKELKQMKSGFEDAGSGALKFGDLLKANVLGDVIVGGIKKLGSAVNELGKAFLSAGKEALSGYSDFEQLEGGVKKLFGDDMASTVISNANNAFKSAGMSANEYLDTVTGFSASLITSLSGNTKKAAEYADRAIKDMSDNANTFGTDMASIQHAYQGFAKGNYTMLDNLKLGYGGTKTEMQRLLKDAQKITGIKYNLSSFADITEAIHVMQKEMNIAGTTSKEAGTTIEGSVNSMKSAWQNLLTGLAGDGENLNELIGNMMTSIFGDGSETNLGVLGNVLPVVERIISSFSTMIPTIVERLAEHIPELLQIGVDMLQNLINGISSALPKLLPVIINLVGQFANFITQNLPTIINAGVQILLALVQGLAESLPELMPAMVDAILLIVNTLIDNIDMIIETGLVLIGALADGLLNSLPTLIEKVPIIIEKLVSKLTNTEMISKLIYSAGYLIGQLAVGLIKALPQLVSKVPEIIKSLVNGLKNGITAIRNVGRDLIAGLWSGIKDKWNSLKDSVSNLGKGIVDKFKSVFGIHSPSRVFKEEIGTNLALGLGEGFSDTMKNISQDMTSAIPTNFDTTVNANYDSNNSLNSNNFEEQVKAFKEALAGMAFKVNDDKFGELVIEKVEKVVYA